jgi:hypothetical protein
MGSQEEVEAVWNSNVVQEMWVVEWSRVDE